MKFKRGDIVVLNAKGKDIYCRFLDFNKMMAESFTVLHTTFPGCSYYKCSGNNYFRDNVFFFVEEYLNLKTISRINRKLLL